MTLRIACLHTVDSNVAVFDAAARGLDVALSHHVRSDLLSRSEAAGGLTAEIRDEAALLLRGLADGADAVLLTCSTVGPAAEAAAEGAAVPILRVDGALAVRAVAAAARGRRRVIALCAVQTTVEPTRVLFERAAAGTGVAIDMRIAPDAWAAFKSGNTAGYHRLVAEAADALYEGGAEVIALAQASMAGAAALCTRGTPLTSPAAGLHAAAGKD
jgi:aspartate/glutamate racemase